MIGLLLPLLAGAALAAPLGSSWRTTDDWSAAGLAWLDEQAARLPPAWRALPVRLVVHDAADPLHPLVAPRGREVAVDLDHLDLANPEVRDRAGRALAHALTHRLDAREGWSADPRFRALSGWPGRPWRGPASEADPLQYARPAGMASPAEDLATLADDLLFPSPVGEGSPRCRARTKWRYLVEQTGLDPIPEAACPSLDQRGLDPDRVSEIDLVLISAAGRAASVAGHMLVALRGPEDEGPREETAYGLVADTTGSPHGLRYLARGILGGFPSRLVAEPLQSTLLRYTQGERRDVRLYRLTLSEPEKRAFLQRLDEIRLGWDRPYAFFDDNCVLLPEELAVAALGERIRRVRPLSPDVLLGQIARQGRLELVPPESLDHWSLDALAAEAARLARREGRALVRAGALERRTLRALGEAEVEARIPAYQALEARAARIAADPGSREAALRLLAWRDPVERALWVRDPRHPEHTGPSPALDAIRAATLAIRGADPPDPAELGDAALLAALSRDDEGSSDHTPFRPLRLAPALVAAPQGAWAGLSLSTALYEGRTSPGRRFPLSDDPVITLLAEELLLSPDLSARRSRTELLRIRFQRDTSRLVGAGAELEAGDVLLDSGARTALTATWASARAMVGLAPGRRWQRDLRLLAGPALRTDSAVDPLLPLHLALPVGVEARLGSGRQQRTLLLATAELAPSLSWAEAPWLDERAGLELGLRLGQIRGVDLVLSASADGRWGLPGQPEAWREASARAGLLLERF